MASSGKKVQLSYNIFFYDLKCTLKYIIYTFTWGEDLWLSLTGYSFSLEPNGRLGEYKADLKYACLTFRHIN